LQEVQEKEMILKTLQEVRYNKSKAARILNIDRKTLYLKMDKYGID
ncbi:MAG TPA: helix-turn-helix domain-containing protein, partial [Chryseosolibacter sp.]|nr:helix-turn-helix domain-containing protein [Chryseosolibacter sp.]